ncbi:hypothetical protein DTO169C6_3706 [Paecilomyces variotii]|nr:hypothetical protein DTO169C6_3706 [Paecilomyces variotii]KAJ9306430.1 hypothetical protein DTO217A2_4169 [Paecilomyces variotii]
MDQATADLLIQLQLEDTGLYFETSKGKSRDLTDEELAFQLQSEELTGVSQFLFDRRMALSFAAAVQADGQILVENSVEEERVAKDRDIARRWRENDRFAATEEVQSSQDSTALDDETLDKLQVLYVSGPEPFYDDTNSIEPASSEAESSSWAEKRNRQPSSLASSRLRRCVACREETDFVNVARVPCRHEYCRSCLKDLFEACQTDESLFPPRCCGQPIVMNIARIFLTQDVVQRYEKKKIEFETPNRVYCYSAECSAFIHTSHIDGEIATCPDCGLTTCTSCKGRAHVGDCPNDTAMQQLLATAQENGWQRCYSCWRMVELEHGCNHMTCRCGAHFCYNCGERWKNCRCEQCDEHRLLARAYQIIDRDREVNPPPIADPPLPDEDHPELEIGEPQPEIHQPQPDEEPRATAEAEAETEALLPLQERPTTQTQTPRDILVARTIQELQENHECDHDRWKFASGLQSVQKE